jgi:hypothetical protein
VIGAEGCKKRTQPHCASNELRPSLLFPAVRRPLCAAAALVAPCDLRRSFFDTSNVFLLPSQAPHLSIGNARTSRFFRPEPASFALPFIITAARVPEGEGAKDFRHADDLSALRHPTRTNWHDLPEGNVPFASQHFDIAGLTPVSLTCPGTCLPALTGPKKLHCGCREPDFTPSCSPATCHAGLSRWLLRKVPRQCRPVPCLCRRQN